MTCESYLLAIHAPNERSAIETAAAAREWVRGYFAGRDAESTRTVDGSLWTNSLEKLLVEQCRQERWSTVSFAADRLYLKLEEKGL